MFNLFPPVVVVLPPCVSPLLLVFFSSLRLFSSAVVALLSVADVFPAGALVLLPDAGIVAPTGAFLQRVNNFILKQFYSFLALLVQADC